MVSIGERRIGEDAPAFFIAELSGNHNGSLERALEIVDAMAVAGVSAVKLQTYTADTMTLDVDREEFTITQPGSLWFGRKLHDLYEEAHTPWEWHPVIFERARERGILAFSSPFDTTAVDFLEDLGAPCYKIASSENIDTPLIRYAARTGKPIIISTGMSDLDEIDDAVAAAREGGCEDLILLKCTASYPASPQDVHLATMDDLRARYDCEVGLSDHTMGLGVAVAAVARGASVVEKHVTLRREDGGVDAAFSMEPDEVAQMVSAMGDARAAVGRVHYGPTDKEAGARTRRRSLYVTQDVRAGDLATAENVRSIRPGSGLPPKHLDEVLGRRFTSDADRGTPLSWDLVGDGR